MLPSGSCCWLTPPGQVYPWIKCSPHFNGAVSGAHSVVLTSLGLFFLSDLKQPEQTCMYEHENEPRPVLGVLIGEFPHDDLLGQWFILKSSLCIFFRAFFSYVVFSSFPSAWKQWIEVTHLRSICSMPARPWGCKHGEGGELLVRWFWWETHCCM